MATQYAAIADLTSLSVTPQAFASLKPAQMNQALLAASAIVDSYLRSKFILPLTQFGQDIVQCVVDLATWRLFSMRGYNPEAPGDMVVRDRYDEQMAWLKAISKGEATPDITDSSQGGSEGAVIGEATVSTSDQRGWSGRGTGQPSGPWDENDTGGAGYPWND